MSLDRQVRDETAAFLAGLADPLPVELDLEASTLALQWIGDALRLGEPVPSALLRWLEGRTMDDLAHGVAELQELLEATVLPADPDDDDGIATVVRVYDRVESAKVALLRACIPRAIAPGSIAGFTEMLECQRRFSTAFVNLGRERVELAMGNRKVLQAPRDWTATLPAREEIAAAAEIVLTAEELASAPPAPDAAVDAYVHRGMHRRWVEGLAAAQPRFADELSSIIGVLNRPGEVLSLVALGWNARRKQTRPVIYAPRDRAAAADRQQLPSWPEVALGWLDPVAATAVLVILGETIELRLFAEPDDVRSVTANGLTISTPDAHGDWCIRIPADTLLTVRVEGAADLCFESSFEIEVFDGDP